MDLSHDKAMRKPVDMICIDIIPHGCAPAHPLYGRIWYDSIYHISAGYSALLILERKGNAKDKKVG